jgi:hypothetical protein
MVSVPATGPVTVTVVVVVVSEVQTSPDSGFERQKTHGTGSDAEQDVEIV